MNTIRSKALAVLAKVDKLLTTEPARLIGYGAAVVVALVLKVLEARGYTFLPRASFEEILGATLAAMASLAIIVESIRRFVYSPQTYIENLSDESQAAHEMAHMEEMYRSFVNRLRQENTDAAVVPIGSASTRKDN